MIEVLNPGIQSSLQGECRAKGLSKGISRSGVLDSTAFRLANIVLSQTDDVACIEVLRSVTEFRVLQDFQCVISGAGMDWFIDEKPLRMGQLIEAKVGQHIHSKPIKKGYRSYLSIFGGFKSSVFFDSSSTDLKLGLGGLGRSLKKGDILFPKILKPLKIKETHWFIPSDYFNYPMQTTLRVFDGPEMSQIDSEAIDDILGKRWKVSKELDRMGIRLAKVNSEDCSYPIPSMYSSTVLPGTVQLTPSGPIILLNDAHTAGGYPRIFQVCRSDLSILAQKSPNDEIAFERISYSEALEIEAESQSAFLRLHSDLQLLKAHNELR